MRKNAEPIKDIMGKLRNFIHMVKFPEMGKDT
jgi:hypothetical protein